MQGRGTRRGDLPQPAEKICPALMYTVSQDLGVIILPYCIKFSPSIEGNLSHPCMGKPKVYAQAM